MLSSFKKNKYYLNQYYSVVITIMAAVVGLGWYIFSPDLRTIALFIPVFALLIIPNIYIIIGVWLYSALICFTRSDFSGLYLLEIPLAVVCTFTATAVLHSASHSSIKPAWLNRLLGEAMAVFQLVGLPDWTVIHVLHHQNSDDPELDPHPPMDKKYWPFLLDMRQSISRVFANYYFKQWGNDEASINCLKKLGKQVKLASLLKLIFWYELFGPQTFTFFFAFSLLFKTLHYAWFNYATHVYTEQGVTIVNLDQKMYKFINFVAFGLYFHKNHHFRPGVFNPSKLALSGKSIS